MKSQKKPIESQLNPKTSHEFPLKNPSINGCFNKSVIVPELDGRQWQDRGVLGKNSG